MQLGYFTMPVHPPERPVAETLREDHSAIVLAESLGFDEAFVGEHLTDRRETITSSLLFLASLVPVTTRIRLGAGTVNLGLRHPLVVAAEDVVRMMVEARIGARHRRAKADVLSAEPS